MIESANMQSHIKHIIKITLLVKLCTIYHVQEQRSMMLLQKWY